MSLGPTSSDPTSPPTDRPTDAEPRPPFGEETVLLNAMHRLRAETATTERLVLDNLWSMWDSMQQALAGMHRDLGATVAEMQRAMQREISHSLVELRHTLSAVQQQVHDMQRAMLLDRVAAQRDLTATRSDLTAQIQLAACRFGGNAPPSAAVAAAGARAATHRYEIHPDDDVRGLAALRQRSARRSGGLI